MTRALWTLTALALWTGCSSAQDDATTPTATADAATDTATGDVAETSEATQGSDADALPTPQWTAATHGKGTAPNYATVLPTDTVQRLDIVIAASDWATLQAELATYASSSSGPGPGGPPGGGGSLDQAFDPSWVPCDVFHAGRQWYKVGIRPKGNSSLQQTVKSGNKKTSFKLDFDQFEDTWPATSISCAHCALWIRKFPSRNAIPTKAVSAFTGFTTVSFRSGSGTFSLSAAAWKSAKQTIC